jgi:ribonucleoside-diphosphate reductase beta chain
VRNNLLLESHTIFCDSARNGVEIFCCFAGFCHVVGLARSDKVFCDCCSFFTNLSVRFLHQSGDFFGSSGLHSNGFACEQNAISVGSKLAHLVTIIRITTHFGGHSSLVGGVCSCPSCVEKKYSSPQTNAFSAVATLSGKRGKRGNSGSGGDDDNPRAWKNVGHPLVAFTMTTVQHEPLLTHDDNRYSLFPVVHQELYDYANKAEKAFWVTSEVELKKDVLEWPTLKPAEQKFISFILAFFSGAENRVIDNLVKRFHEEVQVEEARLFYEIQIGVEGIHKKQYNLIIDALIPNADEQKTLFASIETVPCIRAKAQWADTFINDPHLPFATRLLAFACVEQIFFSASFAAIYWVKIHLKKLPGLTHSNELISRDEGLHCDFAIHLYNEHVVNKLSPDKVAEVVRAAAEIEKNFVRDSLDVKLVGMSSELMCEYVEYVADRMMTKLRCQAMYNTPNPFSFMRFMSAPNKSNFFERHVSEYSRGAHNTDNVINSDNW